jgi:hypothetical protein
MSQPDTNSAAPAKRTATSPHPPHLARKILQVSTGSCVGWSIYPEQLPAMQRQVAEVLFDMWYIDDGATRRRYFPGCMLRAAQILKNIGLHPDNTKISNAGTKTD